MKLRHHRFLIYERMPYNSKTHYGEIDTVVGGLCIMNSCTVQGAKHRIDNLLNENGENRAIAMMKRDGIEVPKKEGEQLPMFDPND